MKCWWTVLIGLALLVSGTAVAGPDDGCGGGCGGQCPGKCAGGEQPASVRLTADGASIELELSGDWAGLPRATRERILGQLRGKLAGPELKRVLRALVDGEREIAAKLSEPCGEACEDCPGCEPASRIAASRLTVIGPDGNPLTVRGGEGGRLVVVSPGETPRISLGGSGGAGGSSGAIRLESGPVRILRRNVDPDKSGGGAVQIETKVLRLGGHDSLPPEILEKLKKQLEGSDRDPEEIKEILEALRSGPAEDEIEAEGDVQVEIEEIEDEVEDSDDVPHRIRVRIGGDGWKDLPDEVRKRIEESLGKSLTGEALEKVMEALKHGGSRVWFAERPREERGRMWHPRPPARRGCDCERCRHDRPEPPRRGCQCGRGGRAGPAGQGGQGDLVRALNALREEISGLRREVRAMRESHDGRGGAQRRRIRIIERAHEGDDDGEEHDGETPGSSTRYFRVVPPGSAAHDQMLREALAAATAGRYAAGTGTEMSAKVEVMQAQMEKLQTLLKKLAAQVEKIESQAK